MAKKHFALKLVPCRPSFAMDMDDAERAIMQEHQIYWKDLMQRGIALIYGPVMDPKGPYGFGVIAVDDEAVVADITAKDPAAAINTYEVYPMMAITPDSRG
jgi:hypothetical protein